MVVSMCVLQCPAFYPRVIKFADPPLNCAGAHHGAPGAAAVCPQQAGVLAQVPQGPGHVPHVKQAVLPVGGGVSQGVEVDGHVDGSTRETTGESRKSLPPVGPGHAVESACSGGFLPFRRDVTWLKAKAAPIQPLLERLDFSAGVKNWGGKFRFGLFSINDHDMDVIADAMGARFP